MVSKKKMISNKRWDDANRLNYTLHLYPGKGDPTREQIKTAAERDGLSVNTWIVECIKDKL